LFRNKKFTFDAIIVDHPPAGVASDQIMIINPADGSCRRIFKRVKNLARIGGQSIHDDDITVANSDCDLPVVIRKSGHKNLLVLKGHRLQQIHSLESFIETSSSMFLVFHLQQIGFYFKSRWLTIFMPCTHWYSFLSSAIFAILRLVVLAKESNFRSILGLAPELVFIPLGRRRPFSFGASIPVFPTTSLGKLDLVGYRSIFLREGLPPGVPWLDPGRDLILKLVFFGSVFLDG
jgi:hypothetical protein